MHWEETAERSDAVIAPIIKSSGLEVPKIISTWKLEGASIMAWMLSFFFFHRYTLARVIIVYVSWSMINVI